MSMEIDVSDLYSSIFVFIVSSVFFLLFKTWCRFFCWLSCSIGIHLKLIWMKRVSSRVNPVFMHYIWSGVTQAVSVFRFLYLGLYWCSSWITWTWILGLFQIPWTQTLDLWFWWQFWCQGNFLSHKCGGFSGGGRDRTFFVEEDMMGNKYWVGIVQCSGVNMIVEWFLDNWLVIKYNTWWQCWTDNFFPLQLK